MNSSQKLIIIMITSAILILFGIGYQRFIRVLLSDTMTKDLLYVTLAIATLGLWFNIVFVTYFTMEMKQFKNEFDGYQRQIHTKFMKKINKCDS